MKRKAMDNNLTNEARYNYNNRASSSWNQADEHHNHMGNENDNDQQTQTPSPTQLSIKPPSSYKEALRQFQQVLWTPSLDRANIILDAYPQVLKHENKIGCLPLHAAIKCTQSSYRTQIIKLIIERGIEYNVGGVDGRGGLLIRSKDEKRRSGLCLLVVGDDKTDILEYLATAVPKPLLEAKDVIEYQLLHRAAGDPFLFQFQDRIKTIQFLIQLCPMALGSRNDCGDLPIHHLCRQTGYSTKVLEILLNEGMKHGIYLEKDGTGKEFLTCCMQEHVLRVLDCIEHDDVPILQNVLGVVNRHVLQNIINDNKNFKSWCKVKDAKGRLPLHHAAEIGMKHEEEMKDILNANIFATNEIDPVTGLYPFLLAACSDGKNVRREKNIGSGIVPSNYDENRNGRGGNNVNGDIVLVDDDEHVDVVVDDDDSNGNDEELPDFHFVRHERHRFENQGRGRDRGNVHGRVIRDEFFRRRQWFNVGHGRNDTQNNDIGDDDRSTTGCGFCDLTSIYILARCNPNCIGYQS